MVATTDSILQRYITPTLITQLVLQLPHDDDRLSSPRLSVLKALYKNCPSLRAVTAHALVVAAHCRLLRCEESRLTARSQGSEVNEASLATHCAQLTGFEGRPKENSFSSRRGGQTKEEQPGTMVRDHDSSVVELTLFILITECTPIETGPSLPQAQSGCDTVTTSSAAWSLSQDSYEVVVSIVTNVMRCYGSRLGKTSGSVEQPGLLKGVFKIVDILMTNKVDSPGGRAAVLLLLRRLVQRWPKGNHVQEVAYLKLCAHILVHCPPAMCPHQGASATATVASSAAAAAAAPADPGTSLCLSRAMELSRARDIITSSPIQKTLRRMVQCMKSAHFKVASLAIQTVMQLNILHPHFISNPNPWTRPPLSSTPLPEDEGVSAVEALVQVLREGREHWHPQVRQLSEGALDDLMDYL